MLIRQVVESMVGVESDPDIFVSIEYCSLVCQI